MSWQRLKTADGRYLQIFPDGTVRGVENPGRGATFEVVPWKEPVLLPSPPEPVLVPITRGDWQANFLYGPQDSYFSPACINFGQSRFQRVLDWNVSKGYTHLVINAAEMDHWGLTRGRPEWTLRRHRWYEDTASQAWMVDRLMQVRAAGLQPIVGLFEHTSLPMNTQAAISRANALMDLIHEHVSLMIKCWETDERIPNSQDRLDFETELLRRVNWHGVDVGIHYSQIKRLRSTGNDVTGAWADAMRASLNPGRVVKLYQSRRNAPIDELRWECELLTDVAVNQGTCLAAFEHSGGDSGIGTVYTEAEANARAKACYDVIRQKLPADRTGSMNGLVR